MRYKRLHRWDVTPKEAIRIQLSLAKKAAHASKRLKKIEKVAGVDVSFRGTMSCAAICVMSYPELEPIEERIAITKTSFPYIPTLLTFREGPAILNCFKKLKNEPDVLLLDGQGIAHPRRMGLAVHIGLWIDIPTIGCAKTPLCGEFSLPPSKRGSYSLIRQKGRPIGAVVRTKDKTKPIYVSQGYRMNLDDAIRISLNSCTRYRIPEPLRLAHILSRGQK